MSILRRLILALALSAGLSPAFAQVPSPVPALPDTERRTSYSISGTTCACAVNFALYGDSTDYQNWVEVYLNGTRVNFNDATFGWRITSPSGSLGSIALPITNAVLTFTNAQTGVVQIVGARRPRRVSQFSENTGVSARNLNQLFTDIIAQNREVWDKTNDMTGRGLFGLPGENIGPLPSAANRAGALLAFDASGNPVSTAPGVGTGNVVGPGSSANGNLACWNGTTGGLLKDCQVANVTTVNVFGFPGSVAGAVVGNLSHDDTAGIQAAITYAETLTAGAASIPCVYFPRPPSAYLISSTLTINKSLCLLGDGRDVSQIASLSNIPYVTLTTASNQMFYGSVSGLGFTTANSGTRTSEAAIKVTGSNLFSYWTFSDLSCYGVYHCFDWSAYTGGGTGWHRFFNITDTNSGAFNSDQFYYAPTGHQGGNIFSNITAQPTTACYTIGDGTYGVGDTEILDGHYATCATGLAAIGGASYGGRFTVRNNQWDAGITTAYNLNAIGDNSIFDDTLGGAVGITVTNPRSNGGLAIKRYATISASLTASVNDYNPTGFALASVLVLSSNGAYNITGLASSNDARSLLLYNNSAFTLALLDQSASSAVANRFALQGSGYSLGPQQAIQLIYNETTSRWNAASQPFAANLAIIASGGTPTLAGLIISGSGTITGASNLALANAATTVAGQTCTLGSTCGLSSLTNSLGGNVALSSSATYFAGPTVAQGTLGTWKASGTITASNSANDNLSCKLWDGTTVMASVTSIVVAGFNGSVSLSGVITSPAGNIRIDCKDGTTTTGLMIFNASGNSKDSTLTVVRIQ